MARYSVQPRNPLFKVMNFYLMLIELQKCRNKKKLQHRIIQKKIFKMAEKYVEQNIYLHNKDRKLLMI